MGMPVTFMRTAGGVGATIGIALTGAAVTGALDDPKRSDLARIEDRMWLGGMGAMGIGAGTGLALASFPKAPAVLSTVSRGIYVAGIGALALGALTMLASISPSAAMGAGGAFIGQQYLAPQHH